jgi:hypothetical protein
MHRELQTVTILMLLGACSPAKATPAALQPAVIKELLDQRARLFSQTANVDGCSLAKVIDSAAFAEIVAATPGIRGRPGQCAEWMPGDGVVLFVFRVADARGDFLPKSLSSEARSGLLQSIELQASNSERGTFHTEEWVIRVRPSAAPVVLAMRVSSIGEKD